MQDGRQHRRAGGIAFVEDIDLRGWVAAVIPGDPSALTGTTGLGPSGHPVLGAERRKAAILGKRRLCLLPPTKWPFAG